MGAEGDRYTYINSGSMGNFERCMYNGEGYLSVEEVLRRPILGPVRLWMSNPPVPMTRAVTIGNNVRLEDPQLIATGTWDELWPLFEIYARML